MKVFKIKGDDEEDRHFDWGSTSSLFAIKVGRWFARIFFFLLLLLILAAPAESVDDLAWIIQGEAGICVEKSVESMLLIAHLYQDNPVMYGSEEPSEEAIAVARHWKEFDHPVPGARYVFGSGDIHKASTAPIISTRPLLKVYDCRGSLKLYVYGKKPLG